MKRTKQRADRAGQAKPEHVSGCRQFEGEDLSKYEVKVPKPHHLCPRMSINLCFVCSVPVEDDAQCIELEGLG